MSDIKRAQLIPFGTQKDNEKSSKEPKKTIRITVLLPESNENTCPEYNYKDELAAAKKLGKYKGSNNGFLRPNDLDVEDDDYDDDDDDDDVRRIAKQMEEKYGTGVSLNKKKRKGRKDDYADIGMGYDESDSFIDNTDGYDEMIPQNVTTLHGGFYINSGALEFKTDDEANSDFSSSSSGDDNDNDENDDDNNDDDNDENIKIKTNYRKRVIESSDETDRENKTDIDNLKQLEKKRKLQNGGNGMQQSIKKKLFNSNKIYVKKRRLIDQQKKTVKELLREKREDLNMSIPVNLKPQDNDNNIDNNDKEIKTTNGNVDDVIESVVKASIKGIEITKTSPINDDNNKNITTNPTTVASTSPATTTTTTPALTTTTPTTTSSTTTTASSTTTTTVAATAISPVKESSHEIRKIEIKLPENLPTDILAILTTIKQLLLKNQNDVKNNIFTNDINRMILRLERKSKCLGKPSKIKVYEYLASFANCKTDLLIQKAKNLILDDEQKKLKTLVSDLKMEINKIMPSLLENHEKESQRVLQKKFSHESIENEDNKSLRMPKRRFLWNDTTKKLLKDILMLKKRCLLLEGKNKETLDARMLSFLKNEIQILWPEGWMSMNALNKIYTTYADPKRLLNNNSTNLTTPTTTTTQNDTIATSTTITVTATTTITTTNSKPLLKHLPQTLSNSNLSIIPVISVTKDIKNNCVDVKNSDVTLNLSRTLPDKSSHCEKISTSPKREVEGRLKVKSPSELMIKPPSNNNNNNNNSVKKLLESDIKNDDSVIIIDRVSPIKDRTLHNKNDHNYQVIDLSDKNEIKKSSDITSKLNLNKHHEVSIIPSYSSISTAATTTTTVATATTSATTATVTKCIDINKSSCGDDIQKVMEDLKVLQKLSSSPKKNLIDNNNSIKSSSSSPSNSSAVSVIAVNKSFTPKTVHNHQHHHQQQQQPPPPQPQQPPPPPQQQQQQHNTTMQRIDYIKTNDFSGSSFQGEFQKQFLSVLNHMKPTSTTNKNNYNSIDTFPHIASGSGMVTNDKYYQTANNNYNQSSNGHKNNASTSQTGTYNILDDMFANFLTQYGYPKEGMRCANNSLPIFFYRTFVFWGRFVFFLFNNRVTHMLTLVFD